MSRLKVYDVPHKGLRNALSQMSLLAGKTNYANRREVEQLYRLGLDVFSILDIHAADENQVTLAELEKRCPGCSRHDVEVHEQLHLAQNKLETGLAKMYQDAQAGRDVSEEGAEFYPLLPNFKGFTWSIRQKRKELPSRCFGIILRMKNWHRTG